MKLLIIEDERESAKLLKKLMENKFDEIKIEDHYGPALRVVKMWRPDLVISDINLNALSGVDVVETMRTNNINIPVIFFSACLHDDEFVEKLKHIENKVNVPKPWNRGLFKRAFEKLGIAWMRAS